MRGLNIDILWIAGPIAHTASSGSCASKGEKAARRRQISSKARAMSIVSGTAGVAGVVDMGSPKAWKGDGDAVHRERTNTRGGGLAVWAVQVCAVKKECTGDGA